MPSATPNHTSRAHALLSASGAARWMNCTPSALLESEYPNKQTAYTMEGTTAHEVAELYLRGYNNPQVSPRGRAAHIRAAVKGVEGADDDMMRHGKAYAEFIAELMAGHDDAALMVEQRLNLTRWIPQGFGTGDAVIAEGNRLIVVDFKYGQGVRVEAEGNPQMRLYALGALDMLADLYDFDEVQMWIFQPRLDHISSATMTVEELTTWAAQEVKPAADLAINGQGEPNPGEWCRFCKHAGGCKVLAAYSCELVSADFDAEEPDLGNWAMDDATMNEAVGRLPIIKAWINAVETAATNGILDGTRELPDWKVVEGRSVRKIGDADKLVEAMKAAGYDDASLYERKLLGITALEKLAGKKHFTELAEGCIVKPQGKPTLAPIGDKREPYSAAADFDAEA